MLPAHENLAAFMAQLKQAVGTTAVREENQKHVIALTEDWRKMSLSIFYQERPKEAEIYFFFAADDWEAMAAIFFWFALLIFESFCPDFFWFAFGDLSPITFICLRI